MCRWFALFAGVYIVLIGPATAQEPKRLPAFDVTCLLSATMGFLPPDRPDIGLGVEADNIGKPRIRLFSVSRRILKVMENLFDSDSRTEYGRELPQITFDFSGRNDVFAWRDDNNVESKVYSFNLKDRILTVVRMPHSNVRTLFQVSTHKC